MQAAIPALVTGGAALLGANKQKKAIARARREQAASAASAQARLDPYQETGTQANRLIQEGLSSGTLGGSFTPQDFSTDPGYQFQLEQGEQALGRQQSATGDLYSGQAIKEGQRFSQGLASQAYQDAYNRWLQTQQNRYNVLSGQQSQGSGIATGQGNIDLGQGNYAAQATMARREAQDRGTSQAIGAGLDLYGQGTEGLQRVATGGMGGSFGGGPSGQTPPIVPSRFISY